MFLFAALFFVIFTIGYGLFVAAILYHLRQYTLPHHPAPRINTTAFFSLAGSLWLIALYLLFRLPS